MPRGHEHQKDVTCVGFPCSLIIVNPKRGLHTHLAKKLKIKATSRPSEKERGFVLVFTYTRIKILKRSLKMSPFSAVWHTHFSLYHSEKYTTLPHHSIPKSTSQRMCHLYEPKIEMDCV